MAFSSLALKRFARVLILSILIRLGSDGNKWFSRNLLGLIRVGFEPVRWTQAPPSITPYKYGADAAFCISIDFDITKESRRIPNALGTRAIVELAEKYNVTMTWAICGQAAAEQPNEIGLIRNSNAGHEIGIHTYTHLDMSLPSTSPELVKSEIGRCFEELNIKNGVKTFIFPWNKIGHFETLSNLGFTTYRGADRKLRYPVEENGLWNISPLYYVDAKSEGASKLMKMYVDLAIAYRSVCHIWFHPWSVVVDKDDKFARYTLDPLLEYVEREGKKGKVWICTLEELSTYCQVAKETTITTLEESGLAEKFAVRSSQPNIPETEVTIEFMILEGKAVESVELDGESTKFSVTEDNKRFKVQVPVGAHERIVEVKFR